MLSGGFNPLVELKKSIALVVVLLYSTTINTINN